MKRREEFKTKLITVLAVLVLGGFLVVGNAAAAMTGSAHDFSGDAWSGGKVCIACHTPHNSDTSFQAPLWNHETTISTFTLYTSPTLDAAVGQPAGASKACLSCHDGTVALDSFGGATGGLTIGGGKNLGTDLLNDHPVSFTYDAALATADGELALPLSTSSVDGIVPLFNGKVECASCHDVHDAGGFNKLLVKSNASSALCFTCHTK